MWELSVLEWFESIHGTALDQVMVGITGSATSGLIWFALGFLMTCSQRWRRCGVSVVVTVAVTYILVDVVLKPLVCRDRPFDVADLELLVSAPDTWSFPSGHTASAFAGAAAILIHSRRYTQQEVGRRGDGLCRTGRRLPSVPVRALAHRRRRRSADRRRRGIRGGVVHVPLDPVLQGPGPGRRRHLTVPDGSTADTGQDKYRRVG